MALVSLTPLSGATVDVEECAIAENETVMCTQAIRLAATATYDRPIEVAAVFAEFYTADGRRCAAASPLGCAGGPSRGCPPLNMISGRAKAFDIRPVVLSFPKEFPELLCPLPVTTTRIDLVLVDVTTAIFQRLVRTEIAATYTFREKP